MTASVTYRAVLDVRRQTAIFLSALLHTQRQTLGDPRRHPGTGLLRQAVLVLRWFLDAPA